jgi:hypothetical protein
MSVTALTSQSEIGPYVVVAVDELAIQASTAVWILSFVMGSVAEEVLGTRQIDANSKQKESLRDDMMEHFPLI